MMEVGSQQSSNDEALEELSQHNQNDQQYSSSFSPTGAMMHRRCRELYSQLTISELSGSVGDLGTFIPLVTALARQNAIYLTPTLFWAGFSNVITGLAWDVPMCVQPMKSIAAVAIAEDLSRHQVTAAGIWMGMFMVLLSMTNGIELINVLVPLPVVSGIQMGVGINLAIRGIKLIQALTWWDHVDCILLSIVVAMLSLWLLREPTGHRSRDHNNHHASSDSNNQREENETEENRREQQENSFPSSSSSSPPPPAPVGLYLFGLGAVLAIVHLWRSPDSGEATPDSSIAIVTRDNNSSLQWFGDPVAVWALKNTTWHDWKQGLLQGALPQLPLTTLNSVVSVCCLAHTLYPEKRRRQQQSANNNINNSQAASSSSDAVISRKEVSWAVGMMNLMLCPLGALPCCHGAGGLAGQHRFGARHGASVVFLGANKMALATFLGKSLLVVLDALPVSILGLMLVVCGHELASMGLTMLFHSSSPSTDGAPDSSTSEQRQADSNLVLRQNAVIALLTVIVDVGLHKTHVAALTGWVSYMVYGDGIRDWRNQWKGRCHGRNSDSVEYNPIVHTEESSDANVI